MGKRGWAIARQTLDEPDRSPLGPADQLGEPPLALDQRQVAQVSAVVLDQVEGVPSSWAITASPSIRNDDALMLSAASTMAGKRSAQSWPLRVKQRTRVVPRAFGGHFAVSDLLGQYFDLVKIQSLASASVAKSPI